jgi:cell division protease FtsH
VNKNVRTIGLYLIIALVLVYVLTSGVLGIQPTPEEITSNQFVQALEDERIVQVTAELRDQRLVGQYYPDDEAVEAEQPVDFVSNFMGQDAFAGLMQENPDVEFQVDPQAPGLLEIILPYLIIGGIMVLVLFFVMNQMQGGNSKIMSFGKAKTKRMTRDQPRITFRDVAGVDEAVEELQEIKEFLANPGKFQALGAKIPKGVLLVGPPGTGKTLLARAVAGEAAVPFFSISGSDFVEMFVGVGASRVRDLFEQAKAASPCIVFMDEIDAVGRHRGAGLGGGHDEREQTLNQLLVEMDGFDIKDNVILVAATNRPDILDPALLRPGRFDRQVVVDRPDLKGRIGILRIHAKGKPIADDADLEVLARRTPGFTGADLANMMNEAALLSARHGRKEIEMSELEEAIDRVVAGPERKTRLISDKEKRVIAFHESGHALVGHVLPNTDPIHKISIIPRGQALGYTLALPTEDKFLVARSEMTDQLAMMLGGRVAEALSSGDITTGASNDIDKATKLARQMVTRYGMSEKLGPMTLGEGQHEVFLGKDFSSAQDYSPEIAYEIDKEVRRLIDEAFAVAQSILEERRGQLDLMAETLIERETVDREELKALLEDRWVEYLEEEKEREAEEASDGSGDASDGAEKGQDKRRKKKEKESEEGEAPGTSLAPQG